MNSLRAMFGEALRRTPRGLLLFAAALALAGVLAAGAVLAGCTRGEPFEAQLAVLQERALWRAEAEVFAADEYRAYRGELRRAKDALIDAERRLLGFRDYEALGQRFKQLLARGDEIHKAIGESRDRQRTDMEARLQAQRDKIERLDVLTTIISVGKASREFLVKSVLLTDEAAGLAARGRYAEAEERLKRATTFTQIAREVITPGLQRFVDQEQISAWRRKVDETIRESKVRGGYAIVVSKVDRQLYLYKAGRLVKTYQVGLGSRSISDKLCAGDRATPEGKYRVTKKVAQSRYHRALLINYPNDEDRQNFAQAKRRGVIPKRAGIGGLIEIHGGGKDGQTYGCVSLDDHHMEEIYALADVNTPVTIVGARDYENSVAQAMKGL